jgi:glutaconate CoA-transferase subunit A
MDSDKIMPLDEAVKKFVPNGTRLRICGIAVRKPFAVINEIVRQKVKDLTLLCSGFTEDADLLIGAGCVEKIEGSYLGLEALGLAYNYRRAIEKGIPNKILVEEYSNFGMTLRFMAAALGIPFMPNKSHLGSDMLKVKSFMEKKAEVIECPFTKEKIVLLPACTPDTALLHVQRVDVEGNAQVWGQICDDEWGTRAAKRIIVTAEEIVDTEVIRRDPNRTIIPGFRVDAIVEAPFGAHPYQVQGYYDLDLDFRMMYTKMSKKRETFLEYLDEWIYSIDNHEQYLEKLGIKRLLKLRAGVYTSSSVNYGY